MIYRRYKNYSYVSIVVCKLICVTDQEFEDTRRLLSVEWIDILKDDKVWIKLNAKEPIYVDRRFILKCYRMISISVATNIDVKSSFGLQISILEYVIFHYSNLIIKKFLTSSCLKSWK